MDEHQSFAVLLRRYRVAARLTQEELAERAGLSGPRSPISNVACGGPRIATPSIASPRPYSSAQRNARVSAVRLSRGIQAITSRAICSSHRQHDLAAWSRAEKSGSW